MRVSICSLGSFTTFFAHYPCHLLQLEPWAIADPPLTISSVAFSFLLSHNVPSFALRSLSSKILAAGRHVCYVAFFTNMEKVTRLIYKFGKS